MTTPDNDHPDLTDYAFDTLDETGRRRVERHLDDCAACRDELAELRAVTDAFASSAAPVAPPPALRETVLHEAATTPQVGRPQHAAPDQPTVRRTPLARRALIAAAVAGVLGVGAAGYLAQRDSAPTVAAVQDAGDARTLAASPPGSGMSLTVVYSKKLDAMVLQTTGMPAAGAGKAYQAWFLTPSGPVSAGILTPNRKVVVRKVPTDMSGTAITVEPSAGSKKPSTPPVVSVSVT